MISVIVTIFNQSTLGAVYMRFLFVEGNFRRYTFEGLIAI